MAKPRSTDERFIVDCLVGAAGGGVAGILAMCLTFAVGSNVSSVIDLDRDPMAALVGLFVLHVAAAMLGALMGGVATAFLATEDR